MNPPIAGCDDDIPSFTPRFDGHRFICSLGQFLILTNLLATVEEMSSTGTLFEVTLLHSGNQFSVATCPCEVLIGKPHIPDVKVQHFEVSTYRTANDGKPAAGGKHGG